MQCDALVQTDGRDPACNGCPGRGPSGKVDRVTRGGHGNTILHRDLIQCQSRPCGRGSRAGCHGPAAEVVQHRSRDRAHGAQADFATRTVRRVFTASYFRP